MSPPEIFENNLPGTISSEAPKQIQDPTMAGSKTVTSQAEYVEASIAMLPAGCGKALHAGAPEQQKTMFALFWKDGSPQPILPPGVDTHWQKVCIRNARSLQPQPSLAKDGFQLVKIQSGVKDWSHSAADELWCDEVIKLAKQETGAQEVFVLGGGPLHRNGTSTSIGYCTSAHIDHSQYCEEFLPASVRAACAGKHFAVYNLWRSTDMQSPVTGFALAFLHPASLCPDDLVYCEQYSEKLYKKVVEASSSMSSGQDARCVDGIPYSTYRAAAAHQNLEPDRHSEEAKADLNIVWRPMHSEQHQWLYFPKMTADEVLIFRQYDTREDQVEKSGVVHSSFREPSDAGHIPRCSCEVRVVCTFGPRSDEAACKKHRLDLIHNAFSASASGTSS
mmetsp:Transcript_88633/g.211629  ORF Transcript_88633/g.211629 Transcript_88633/m.211629 type:complete len:391 (+) Transcript_88633:29-1201(+)